MSKLCAHFQTPPELGTEATTIVRTSQMPWVKAIDADKHHAPAREMFPGKRVLARLWLPKIGDKDSNAQEREYMLRGEQGARDYVALLGPRYDKLALGGCLDAEGPNEPHPDSTNWRAYDDFETAWCCLMSERGLRPWAWGFGVGWPGLLAGGDPVPVGQLWQSIGAARAAGGGLTLHEYGAPTMSSGDGWWTLRYRKVLAELADKGLGNVQIIISECGIDGGVAGNPGQGWKRYANREQYQGQLAWYDSEISKDPQVLAATPFTTCPTQEWATFDIDGVLLRWMASQYSGQPPTPPPPVCPDMTSIRAEIEEMMIHVDAMTLATTAALRSLSRLYRLIGRG